MSEQLTYSAFESRFQNKTLIGSGGFAKVFKVFDHAKNHYVALKVADVRPELKKFTLKNEVELVNKLQPHRNIARYDACYRFNTGFTGEMDFALLKFYEYGNLEQFLKREQLELEDKKLIIQGILNGIDFLHQNNFIHRDMKAQNILMNREDGVWTPKITDFGLSREMLEEAAVENTAIGMSYSYAAPEQIQNKKINKNVDLWAVGVIIYRIMANELPFKGKPQGDDRSTQSQLEISKKIINLELPEKLDNVPEPFQKMIRRCLVLDPLERVNSARELIDILLGHDTKDYQVNSGTVSASTVSEDVPPLDSVPGDATVVMNNGADGLDRTEVIEEVKPESVQNLPPDPKSFIPPASNYAPPKENLTQFISPEQQPIEDEEKPVVVTDYEPRMGDPKKGFKPIYVLLPIILIAVGTAVWYFGFKNETNTKPSVNTLPPAEESVSNNDQYTALISEVDSKIEKAGATIDAQQAITPAIRSLLDNDDNLGKYEPLFLQAKHQAFLELSKGDPSQENYRKAGNSLRQAAEKAILNQQQPQLLEAMRAAENTAFINLKQAGGGSYYKNILKSLSP